MARELKTSPPLQEIVIVGGGTAGWLTACVLGAEFDLSGGQLAITVVESPDTPPIGVGEGTWPSMRSTLQKIGISETTFVRECQASMKQGTWFRDWMSGHGDSYYHPFTLPKGYEELNLADYWLAGLAGEMPFSEAVTAQSAVCDHQAAPKQIGVPEYGYVLNYGYHLDAGKFADLLRRHATGVLGVRHTLANVESVDSDTSGDIAALNTDCAGRIAGDFFIDCSGMRALLIGEHFDVPLKPIDDVLFNDRALALQVDYEREDSAVSATTWSTAQTAGWVWDIGLRERRGVGYVFSSQHTDEQEAAQVLDRYLQANRRPDGIGALTPRLLRFSPGYRQTLWHRNCVAVGLSAGFVEPLEASALVLVEMSARAIAEQLPATRTDMDGVASRFNREFSYRWAQIVDFLKLHYVLSQRNDSEYWRDNRNPETIPASLAELLESWQSRTPWHLDETRRDEMFPSASYQYVLLGMGFRPSRPSLPRRQAPAMARRASELLQEVQTERARFLKHLPSTRKLLTQVSEQPFALR